MSKKLDTVKNTKLFSTLIIFVFLFAKGLLEFSRLGKLQVKYVVFIGAACIALTVFIFIEMMPSLTKEINGRSVVGILALVHLFVYNISEEIIKYDTLIFLICVSVALLLAQNIWALIAATVGSVVMAVLFNHAAVSFMPAVMAVSAFCFAPLFKKAKPLSKKKAKKNIVPEQTVNNKKEQIIFLACQAIMLASLIYAAYMRRYTVVAANLKYNVKFYIISVVLCVLLVVLAVIAIKAKRTWVETAGYLIPVVFMVPAAFSEYYVAVNFALALLFMLFIACGKETVAAEKAEQIFGLVREKAGKKAEPEEI